MMALRTKIWYVSRCTTANDLHKITKYILDIQSEHNYISNIWYIKYQLHVSATILAIIRLYSTYQLAVQYMWYILGETRSRLQ